MATSLLKSLIPVNQSWPLKKMVKGPHETVLCSFTFCLGLRIHFKLWQFGKCDWKKLKWSQSRQISYVNSVEKLGSVSSKKMCFVLFLKQDFYLKNSINFFVNGF